MHHHWGKRWRCCPQDHSKCYMAMLLLCQWAWPTVQPTQSERGGWLWPHDLAGGTEVWPDTFVHPWTTGHHTSLSFTNSKSLLKLISIESVMISNHLILCCPLHVLPSIFWLKDQHQGLFKWVLRIRWPKYWSFSFNIKPFNEYSGLIFFMMNWLDLLVVQGTLKNLLQHHSSKASILQRSAFFIVQFSYPYVTTGKTVALNRWTFIGKVISLLFNILSRLVITFLPRASIF